MKLSKENFLKARDFILTNARMIERRLFQFYFENNGSEGVFHAVYAYRNSDGGFGHGMEPDTASPESQPLFSIMALDKDTGDILGNRVLGGKEFRSKRRFCKNSFILSFLYKKRHKEKLRN